MKLVNVALRGALALVLSLVGSGPTAAQQSTDSARIAELERQIDAVSRELEGLRLGSDVVRADTSVHGFGPAASKVYNVGQGVSVGGYGEVLYENYATGRQDGSPSDARSRFDAYRAILYVGYKFDDRLLFNSEIEVEHTDEIELEFAYVDYLLSKNVGLRAGLLLTPVGLLNELHEPPVFLGTERPVTETLVIPTTWRENGIGLFGRGDTFDWRVYLMTGLDAQGLSAGGLRDARQEGSKAVAHDLSFVGRLDYVGRPGLVVGGSAYYGKTGQGAQTEGAPLGAGLFLWDLHADYKVRGFDLRALATGTQLNDVTAVNEYLGLTGADAVAQRMLGWYLQGGYDVLRGTGSAHQLIPYVRYERVNTQHDVAAGFAADPANDQAILSVGAAWKPVAQVVAKLGYQVHHNQATTGLNQWNVQLGWLF